MLWGLCRIGQLICFRACHSFFEFDNGCVQNLVFLLSTLVLWSSLVHVTARMPEEVLEELLEINLLQPVTESLRREFY